LRLPVGVIQVRFLDQGNLSYKAQKGQRVTRQPIHQQSIT